MARQRFMSGRWAVAVLVLLAGSGICHGVGVDCNGNGTVGPEDPEDVAIVISAWRQFHQGSGHWDARGDVDGDRDVDMTDALLVLDAFLSGQEQEFAKPAHYFRMADGDHRLWEKGGIVATIERVTAESESVVRTTPSTMFGDNLWSMDWQVQDNAAASLVNFVPTDHCGVLLVAADQGGVSLPLRLYLNAPWVRTFEITNDLGRPDLVGEGWLGLTLLATGQTVTVPAGEFHACIELKMELGWRTEASSGVIRYWIWMAPGIGAVKQTTDLDPFHGQYEKLYWASLPGKGTYGERPQVTLREVFGLGGQYFWEEGNRLCGQFLTNAGNAFDLCDMTTPADSYIAWTGDWTPPGSEPFCKVRLTGVAGWSQWGGGGEYTLAEPLQWGAARVFVGQPIMNITTVEHAGEANYGDAVVYVRPVGTGKTVFAPAGRFDDCVAVAVRGTIRRGGSVVSEIRRVYWIDQTYGPVRYDDYVGEGAPRVYELAYGVTPELHASVGQPPVENFDYLHAVDWQVDDTRKMTDGNAWRIVTTGGWERMPDGKFAWTVLDIHGVGYNANSITVNTEYYGVTPDRHIWYYGQRPDPATLGEDVYLEPADMWAWDGTLNLGAVWGMIVELRHEGNAVKTLQREWIWGNEEPVFTPAGNFNAHVVWMADKEISPTGQVLSWIVRKQYFDDEAGLVREIEWDATQVPLVKLHDWVAEWIRAHGNTYGDYPGRVDLLARFPMHENDEWRFGNANTVWHQWVIGAADLPINATEEHFPRTWRRWRGNQKEAVLTEWWEPGSNAYTLAYEQAVEPDAHRWIWQLNPAVQLQRWWYAGSARAFKLVLKRLGQAAEWPGREVWIMLDGGLTEDVPAGHFEDCCRVLRLSTRREQYGWEWRYYDMYMAPVVGPVYVVVRESPHIFGSPGLAKWIQMPGRTYGQWP